MGFNMKKTVQSHRFWQRHFLVLRNQCKICKLLDSQKQLTMPFPLGLYWGSSSTAINWQLCAWRSRVSYLQWSCGAHRPTLSSDTGGMCAEHSKCTDALKLVGPGHISLSPGCWAPWAPVKWNFEFLRDINNL